jgi:nucleoside-diphosphate-sugar epimerase
MSADRPFRTNGNPSHPVVLITGSSGLIGTRLINELAAAWTVVGLDQKPPKDPSTADFVQCDLTDDNAVAQSLQKVRERHGSRIASVIHLAAYYDFKGEPSPLYDTLTVQGTRRLMQQLKKFEVEQFIFSSSLLVMKPANDGEELTESFPTEGTWDYPRSKLEAEEVIRHEHGETPVLVMRIAGVYDEDGHSVPIGQQIRRIYEKEIESYFFPGDAETGQAFVHLEDLAEAFRLAVEQRHQLGPYEVLLIAEPDVITYSELQDVIGEELHGKEWPTIRIPKVLAKAGAWVQGQLADEDEGTFIKPWMVDLADAHYPVDISRARTLLGWEPPHRLRNTIHEILNRLKEHPKAWYQTQGYPTDDLE